MKNYNNLVDALQDLNARDFKYRLKIRVNIKS